MIPLQRQRHIFHRLVNLIGHVLHNIVSKTPSDKEGFQGSLVAEMSDDKCLWETIFTAFLKSTQWQLWYTFGCMGTWRQCERMSIRDWGTSKLPLCLKFFHISHERVKCPANNNADDAAKIWTIGRRSFVLSSLALGLLSVGKAKEIEVASYEKVVCWLYAVGIHGFCSLSFQAIL